MYLGVGAPRAESAGGEVVLFDGIVSLVLLGNEEEEEAVSKKGYHGFESIVGVLIGLGGEEWVEG